MRNLRVSLLVSSLLAASATFVSAQCVYNGAGAGGSCDTAGLPATYPGPPLNECVDSCGVAGGPAGCTGTLTTTITSAACSTSGGGANCPTVSCASTDNLVGGGGVTFVETSAGVCTSPRQVILCGEWVDCSGGVVCGSCQTGTITLSGGQGTWAAGTISSCNPGAGTFQFKLKALDVTGRVTGMGAPCNTCGSSCAPGGTCDDNMTCGALVALRGSCALDHL